MIFICNSLVIIASSKSTYSSQSDAGLSDLGRLECVSLSTLQFLKGKLAMHWWRCLFTASQQILMLAMIFQITAYSIMTARPIFPLMCIGFYINGMGMSLINAQGNAILSMMHNPTAMGFAHASYGAGALVAPLISTQFAKRPRWSLHYSVLLGVALLDLVACTFVFKGKGHEEVLAEMGVSQHEEVELRRTSSRDEEEVRSTRDSQSFSVILRMPHVHILAAFVFIYVGVEVTIGGQYCLFRRDTRF